MFSRLFLTSRKISDSFLKRKSRVTSSAFLNRSVLRTVMLYQHRSILRNFIQTKNSEIAKFMKIILNCNSFQKLSLLNIIYIIRLILNYLLFSYTGNIENKLTHSNLILTISPFFSKLEFGRIL